MAAAVDGGEAPFNWIAFLEKEIKDLKKRVEALERVEQPRYATKPYWMSEEGWNEIQGKRPR